MRADNSPHVRSQVNFMSLGHTQVKNHKCAWLTVQLVWDALRPGFCVLQISVLLVAKVTLGDRSRLMAGTFSLCRAWHRILIMST